MPASSPSRESEIAHEPSAPLAPRDEVEGVMVDSLEDMHANKITCLLSRSEPRDLVDLYFLDRAGQAPEAFLLEALQKDAGVDPGILSFLLKEFPVAPIPVMLQPLDENVLVAFPPERTRVNRTFEPHSGATRGSCRRSCPHYAPSP